MKKCKSCEVVKTPGAFALNRTAKDGRRGVCKRCTRALASKQYKEFARDDKDLRNKAVTLAWLRGYQG